MVVEKLYDGYRVVTDDSSDKCQVYEPGGQLIADLEGWDATGWEFEEELFHKGFAHLGSFDESSYRCALLHRDRGVTIPEGVRVISSLLWAGYMWVLTFDDKCGLLDFDLNWVLPPIYDHAEASDQARNKPYISFYKGEREYVYTDSGVLYPQVEGGEAEILNYEPFWLADRPEEACYHLSLKERNAAGKWQFVLIRKLGETHSCYESGYLYDSIEGADNYAVTCVVNGVREYVEYPEMD